VQKVAGVPRQSNREIREAKSEGRNPKAERSPKSEIRTHEMKPPRLLRASSFILHPSSFSHHPSAIILQPSSFSHHPSAIRHPPSAIRHPPSAIRHPPSAIRHPPSAIIRSSDFRA
jgi:hypothetical protein